MAGNSIIEDPGIPLVGGRNGHFTTYVEESSSTSMSQVIPVSKQPTMRATTKFDNISYRLSHRKNLLNKRRMLINVEFAFAMLGIILMLVDTELFIAKVYKKNSTPSIVIKSCISASTVILLGAVVVYHALGVQVVMTDNSLEDWRLAVTPQTYCKLLFELLVCSIHPIPGKVLVEYKKGEVSVDAVLAILMLSRLYLVIKLMVVHSHLLSDTSTQSLGALNKVKISPAFVFKSLMSDQPGTMLMAIMCLFFFINCWAMRTCESFYDPNGEDSLHFRKAVWLIAITFLTVGYGDVVPKSECGRFIAVTTGLMGVGTTALLVAVLAHKLEQSRAEKYVHNFAKRIQLDKMCKHAAANIIKNVLLLWRLKKKGFLTRRKRLVLHSKVLYGIHTMRYAKQEKSIIGENSIGPVEIHTGVDEVMSGVENVKVCQTDVKNRVLAIENKLGSIDKKLDSIQKALEGLQS